MARLPLVHPAIRRSGTSASRETEPGWTSSNPSRFPYCPHRTGCMSIDPGSDSSTSGEDREAADGAAPSSEVGRPHPRREAANADLLLPYFAPYAAYVGVGALAADLSRPIDYSIRIVVTGLMLWAMWKHFPALTGPRPVVGSVLLGAAAGLLGVVLWIALVLPFQDARSGDPFGAPAFALRLAAATLLVPLIEELLFRRYILGFVVQWQEAHRSGASGALGVTLDQRSVRQLAPGAWTGAAAVLSSVAFALGHAPAHWLAAFAYGLLMAALWIVRRDLVAPITAHAVTNLALYVFVFLSHSWGLW